VRTRIACGVGLAVTRVVGSAMVYAAVHARSRQRIVMRARVHEPRVQGPCREQARERECDQAPQRRT
jgi:hypothetical protein